MAERKVVDCRDTPSDINCSLTIAGTEEEVMEAAVQHMASVHSHPDSPEVRQMVKDGMKDEA